MEIRIYDDFMCLSDGYRVLATALWSRDNTADCSGAWSVSWCTNRLFNRDQAITALTVAELRAVGRSDDDPVVATFLEELC